MPTKLNEVEIRILGALLEKEKATPDYYPLTLNALTNACNQKSSRDPVLELDQTAVMRALFSLKDKGLIVEKHEEGSRAVKYGHRFESLLKASDQERAALCVLMLRGPQTPGEIKTRSERLASFESPAEVESILQGLAARPDGAFVKKLDRQPGQKESRYAHLLAGETAEPIESPAPSSPSSVEPAEGQGRFEIRLEILETQVAEIRRLLKLNK